MPDNQDPMGHTPPPPPPPPPPQDPPPNDPPPPPPPPPGDMPQASAGPDLGACLKESWGWIKAYPVPFILGNLIMMIVSSFAMGLLTGPWYAGMIRMAAKARAGDKVALTDVFSGFDDFGNVFGAGIIWTVALTVGAIFCIIPLFIVGGYLLYFLPMVAVGGVPLADALNQGAKHAGKALMSNILFFFVISLIGASGLILCYVGVIFTAPFAVLAVAAAYFQSGLPLEDA